MLDQSAGRQLRAAHAANKEVLMLNVIGLRVRNLRSLRDTGWIEIRPITILVGKNSSGKSTLARVFPLLKQSAERRKQAPLLWFGRLVDFGSFSEAVSTFATPPEIEVSLRVESDSALTLSRRAFVNRQQVEVPRSPGIDVVLSLTEGSDGRTQVKGLSLDVYGVRVVASNPGTQEESLQVNGRVVVLPPDGRLIWSQGEILPLMRLYGREAEAGTVSDEEFSAPRRRLRLGEDGVVTAITRFVHGNTLRDRMLDIADRLPVAAPDVLLQQCRSLPGTPESWRHSIDATQATSPDLLQLQRAVVLYKLDLLLNTLDDGLGAFCSNVRYLEPLRATAQRYYRREETSVDELDPKGLNTAFLIQSLSARERESLNDWLHETFGFRLTVRATGGHLALLIDVDQGDGQSRNMADVGLGYSQLAPVAIQLWLARQGRRPVADVGIRVLTAALRPRHQPLVVVEQPELHLHPAFQGKLADVFVASVRAITPPQPQATTPAVRIVAETHSSHLVGRLGELVGRGEVPAQDISVLVFEPDAEVAGASSIRTATFDNEGVLRNWPIGFFDA